MAVHHSAVVLGLLYGALHVIGPDHIGTIMSLSVAASPRRAFSVGAWWSIGHTAGMAFLAGILVLARHLFKVDVKVWEHIGDYVIGASMLLCGLYFLAREDKYVVEGADGSVSLQGCECHGPGAHEDTVDGHHHHHKNPEEGICTKHGKHEKTAGYGGCEDARTVDKAAGEHAWVWQSAWSAVLGLVQGLCCPMGWMGLLIAGSLPAAQIAVFVTIFLLVSVVGIGAFALAWAQFARSGVVVSARLVYRGSAILTMGVGLIWIVANYLGILDKLNYAESGVAKEV